MSGLVPKIPYPLRVGVLREGETMAGLRERIAELEEENAALKAGKIETDIVAFAGVFGLATLEARLLGAVMSRTETSKEQVFAALYGENSDHWPTESTVKVHLCRLRQKLARFGAEIETIWGRGLRVSPESRAIIEEWVAAWRADRNAQQAEKRSAS